MTDLPPVLFPPKTTAERKQLAALKASGKVRLVGPRLYVSVPDKKAAAAIRAAWSTVVSRLFPDALISHRTALEFAPTSEGEVIVTGSTNRVVSYPGLKIRFVRGPKPLSDDPKFLSIRASSTSRALLENLETTHPTTRTRILPIDKVEQRLEQILHVNGEAELGRIRDRAREIARELDWDKQYERLDALIGTLLGTRAANLVSAVGRARAIGEPFDVACLERMQLLFAALKAPLPDTLERFDAPEHYRNKAFFEAYFSNYIEGTTFELAEAEQIAFERRIPERRPADAHDILGTFEIVSDPGEMKRTPGDFAELLKLLQARHRTLMGSRPEKRPGEFKIEPNRAGDTRFVMPEYVLGTLKNAFGLYGALPPGLPRAVFLMFAVSDVHPFDDGNGRIARIMMNAELVSANRSTIIIPTVFRDDYLAALRALTRRHRPDVVIQMATKAQRFSNLDFSTYLQAVKELERRNWFREPDEARIVVD